MGKTQAKVTLLRYTTDPGGIIATAGKLCYAKSTDALFEQEPDESEQFIDILTGMGHLSPIEHAVFTFYIEGVSRAMTHQLVRHRIASYSQRSQRYVAHEEFDYVVPPQLTGKTVRTDKGEVPAEEYYEQTMEILARRYNHLNQALGDLGEKSNEDARYVLPNACETKIVVTMNARTLLNFFEERLCHRAQWEIRKVANAMLELVKEVFPSLFNGIGPKCVSLGKCPEGKLACGHLIEVRKQYAVSQSK